MKALVIKKGAESMKSRMKKMSRPMRRALGKLVKPAELSTKEFLMILSLPKGSALRRIHGV